MTTNPACPPVPTLDELLNSGNFIEVNINNLEVGETVIKYDPVVLDQNYQIRCVEILINSPEDVPNDEFGFRYASGLELGIVRTVWKRWIGNTRFFRKINHSEHIFEVAKAHSTPSLGYPNLSKAFVWAARTRSKPFFLGDKQLSNTFCWAPTTHLKFIFGYPKPIQNHF